MTDETLIGVSSISQPIDDPRNILKPSLNFSAEKTEISVGMTNQEQVEGLFGNLVDDDCDEGENVHLSENETSQAMDVDGSLAGENASGGNLVSEGNAGFLADENEGNANGDPIDISLVVEKEKNDENGTTIVESKDDTGEEDVKNREDNGSKLAESEGDEEDHDFVVGDFVWGKMTSHTWWPGQIYDPSDASDNAARLKLKGRILVAYFGNGSFSWCSASELKPFIDHFPEMSNQSASKKFVNAVQMALEEVSRQAGWMCNCQPVNRVGRSGMVNRGIKEGVCVRKGNTVKVLKDRFEPVELLLNLKGSAMIDPGAGLAELDLALLKCWLNGFYSRKNGFLLARYHDPECIEGLEDETRSGDGFGDDTDINGPLESIDNGDDKSCQTRKQKSVAELLREEEQPNVKKPKASKDGGSGMRKRKALVVSVTPENDFEEETISSRQRKKSKYLSPPYLSPIVGGKLSILDFGSGPGSGSGSGSFKEPKPEPENVEDSLKKISGKKTRQKRVAPDGSDSQEEQKKAIDAAVNVNEVLRVLLLVALDPTSFVENNVPAVTDFVSSYRASVCDGSNYPTVEKKNAWDTSDMVFIKQKLESMMETVRGCEETEMSADVKASLEGGILEVLQKVGKMKRK